MEHMASGGCNDYVVTLILMQLVSKLVRKLKVSLWVQFPPNELSNYKKLVFFTLNAQYVAIYEVKVFEFSSINL